MNRELTEVKCRVTARPFRVGQIVDTSSADAVRQAIANLTRTWGGHYTPILDVNQQFTTVARRARAYDLDAVELDGVSDLSQSLSDAGWLWRGRGEYGPFAERASRYRTGVLQTDALDLPAGARTLVDWEAGDSLDLFYSALFGVTLQPTGPENEAVTGRVGMGALLTSPTLKVNEVGDIHLTRAGLTIDREHRRDGVTGIYVVRRDRPDDAVAFWNLRAMGHEVVPVPDDGDEALLRFLTRDDLPGVELRSGSGPDQNVWRELIVWGLEDASPNVTDAVRTMSNRLGLNLSSNDREVFDPYIFHGLESQFSSSFRSEIASGGRSFEIPTPPIPLIQSARHSMPGIVAIEVDQLHVVGLDPRYAESWPPQRRFGALLSKATRHSVDHLRVTVQGGGVVFGVQATSDEVALTFPFQLDAIHTLFDDNTVRVKQSDVGRFQTRAAEVLGGQFSDITLQPGVRALIMKTGRSPVGLTLQQMRTTLRQNRGDWPGRIRSFHTTPDEHDDQTLKRLLFSGLFIPQLDIHCSHCRVESQISPRDLDATIQCEFCGQTFRLALSLALASGKGRWRYRLASHLGVDKIEALLPALATMSLLGQLGSSSDTPGIHSFGVEFEFSTGDKTEADVVTYMPRDGVVVLGEVKNSNRIDQNDVENLEQVQRRLDTAGFGSVLNFVTLKDRFAPAERAVLRSLVERSTEVETIRRAIVPRLPLVLTARDLSLPWMHDDHPIKWTQSGSGNSVYDTATESCKRNLGLSDIGTSNNESRDLTFAWTDAVSPELQGL